MVPVNRLNILHGILEQQNRIGHQEKSFSIRSSNSFSTWSAGLYFPSAILLLP
jgi:hypothetical protein